MDVNAFVKFLNAQSGSSPLLYFDLLRNTVCFTAEPVLNQWNSRVHRILVSTLAIHSATEPPSNSSIVPASLFAELYRIMLEHSLPLVVQLQTFLLEDLERSVSPEVSQTALSTIFKLLHSALAYCIALMELCFEKTSN